MSQGSGETPAVGEALAGLPDKALRDLPRVVNRLLGQTFVYQDKDADKDDYYFVHRHRPAVAAALALAGFELMHDDYHRIYQVVSRFGYCRARYRLDISLMIVVLRKLYEERAAQLSLAGDPVVSLAEIREEYRTITGKERDLGVVQYERLMRRCKRLGLVEPVEGRSIDVRDGESRLRLRGSVRLILPIAGADEMAAWLRRYRREDPPEAEEADGEDAVAGGDTKSVDHRNGSGPHGDSDDDLDVEREAEDLEGDDLDDDDLDDDDLDDFDDEDDEA